MNAGQWGQLATVVAIVLLVLFILRGVVDFRFARERPGEWHVGLWYNRGSFSVRLFKWALIWSIV